MWWCSLLFKTTKNTFRSSTICQNLQYATYIGWTFSLLAEQSATKQTPQLNTHRPSLTSVMLYASPKWKLNASGLSTLPDHRHLKHLRIPLGECNRNARRSHNSSKNAFQLISTQFPYGTQFNESCSVIRKTYRTQQNRTQRSQIAERSTPTNIKEEGARGA